MSKILFASIFIFAFCFSAFAQTNEAPPCPIISVRGLAGIPDFNESITFSADVDKDVNNFNIKYVWTVYGGKIIEGEGTKLIKVLYENRGNNLTATVKIEGLPENCPNTSSETMACPLPPPKAIKIDEFIESIANMDYRRSEKLIKALQDDQSAQLFVIVGKRLEISNRQLILFVLVHACMPFYRSYF